MRITNNTMNKSFLNNLNRNLRNMQRAQEQATSGKRVSRPSDDPLLVGKILSMRDNIQQNEQYNSNISDTLGWVQTQDTALNDVTKTMNRVRELIIYGANGSLSETDRLAIKDEVESAVGELREVLNTNFDGRYIFGGHKTTEAPFKEKYISGTDDKSTGKVENGLDYVGDSNNIEREISQGVTIDLITVGSKITQIGEGEDNDLGHFLNSVIKALDSSKLFEGKDEPVKKTPEEISGDLEKLSGDYLAKADKFIDNILQVRSKVGAIHNRLEAAEERNSSENINLKEVLSEKEDIDLAETYMEYIMLTTAYQASLSMGAKILQPSLLDYLR